MLLYVLAAQTEYLFECLGFECLGYECLGCGQGCRLGVQVECLFLITVAHLRAHHPVHVGCVVN